MRGRQALPQKLPHPLVTHAESFSFPLHSCKGSSLWLGKLLQSDQRCNLIGKYLPLAISFGAAPLDL